MKNLSELSLNELSGTELVTVMNKVMAEVKSRLDEGTVTKYVAREIPSTIKVLKLSDLKKGDKVKFIGPQNAYPGSNITVGNVYDIVDDDQTEYVVFVGDNGSQSTRQTIDDEVVHLFEKVVVDSPQIIKSSNQQRAELIQRAREFVEEHERDLPGDDDCRDYGNRVCRSKFYDTEFFVKENKVTTVVRVVRSDSREPHKSYKPLIGRSKCAPGDVLNEWIGKAIALCKALKIDIPQEFMEAVQPDEPVIGMIFKGCEGDIREIAPIGQWTQESMKSAIDSEYVEDNPIQIIDDTNAVYVVSK